MVDVYPNNVVPIPALLMTICILGFPKDEATAALANWCIIITGNWIEGMDSFSPFSNFSVINHDTGFKLWIGFGGIFISMILTFSVKPS